MINLAFDNLDPEQALALLSTYQSTKPAVSNVIPFPAKQPVAEVAPLNKVAPVEPNPQPAPEPPVAPPAAVVPTAAAPSYTFDDLAHAAAPLMDAGKTPELQGLLRSFGVQALTQLPKERYGEFATALRGMGARL
ncbi:MAG TPA: hypothetical protein VN538_12540 [Clostridia bacterium]|nr:hypothetical protein [Clostridia bacterium]